MSVEKYKVQIFSIGLVADAGESGDVYKIEYSVLSHGIVGRFLTKAKGFDESKIPELIRADIESMLPHITKLIQLQEQFVDKTLDV